MKPAALTLRGRFQYADGGEYQVWTLTADVPSIPCSAGGWLRNPVGPAHAAAGDELWEEPNDREATPFRLLRAGQEIATPEWWQVAPLFDGAGDGDNPPCADVGTGAEAVSLIPRELTGSLFRLTNDVPAARLRRSTVIFADYSRSPALRPKRIPAAFGPLARPIPRAAFSALVDAVDEFEFIESSWDEVEARRKVRRTLMCAIGSLRGGNAKHDGNSPLWIAAPGIVRPELVTTPLRASCDAVAVAMLIIEAGCRPPIKRERER